MPLLTSLVVTITVNVPAVGAVLKVMVNEVAVTAVTVPTPEDSVTVFVPLGSKPTPMMVNVLELAARLAVFNDTTG